MKLDRKHLLILVAIAGAAVVAYVGYRWWQARQPGTPVGGLGTNLNSVAPELVGGSTGPSVGPAVNTPISITLNEAANSTAPAQFPDNMQQGVNARVLSPLWRQRDAVTPGVVSPTDQSGDNGSDSASATPATDAIDGGADTGADNTVDQGVAA